MSESEKSAKVMIANYREVIDAFASGSISAGEFETEFLRLFKNDKTQVEGSEYDTLERIFFDVEDYVEDPDLRDGPKDIGPDELRVRVRLAFDKLYE